MIIVSCNRNTMSWSNKIKNWNRIDNYRSIWNKKTMSILSKLIRILISINSLTKILTTNIQVNKRVNKFRIKRIIRDDGE